MTRFNNPATFAPFIKFLQPKLYNTLDSTVSDNSYLWEYNRLPVEEDDVFIFPAVLNHEVTMQRPTKEPRITISTNLKLYLEEKK